MNLITYERMDMEYVQKTKKRKKRKHILATSSNDLTFFDRDFLLDIKDTYDQTLNATLMYWIY